MSLIILEKTQYLLERVSSQHLFWKTLYHQFFHPWTRNKISNKFKKLLFILLQCRIYVCNIKTCDTPKLLSRLTKHYCVSPGSKNFRKKQKYVLSFGCHLLWLSKTLDVWKQSNWNQQEPSLMAILFFPNRSLQGFYRSHKMVYEALMGSWQPWLPTVTCWKAILHSFKEGLWSWLFHQNQGNNGH